MSASREKRKPALWGVFSDPWRKIASIALALLLWYWLNSQIARQEWVSIPVGTDAKQVTGDHVAVRLNSVQYAIDQILDGESLKPLAAGKVRLKLGGTQQEVEQFKKGLRVFRVELSDGDVTTEAEVPSAIFRLRNLRHRHDPEYEALLREMEPESVRVTLVRLKQRDMPLSATNVELEGVTDELKSRIKKETFNPPTVQLRGPERELDRLSDTEKLFRVAIDARAVGKDTSTVRKALSLRPELAARRIVLQGEPTVTFAIEPVRTRFLLKSVPVVLDTRFLEDGSAKKVQLQPATWDIEIGASGRLLSELTIFRRFGEDEPHEVRAEWCREHARFHVFLRPEDLAETPSPRRPSLHLFNVDRQDGRTDFLEGSDYEIRSGLPIINLKRE